MTEKDAARAMLNRAVKAGTIRRPSLCESCSRERPTQGHHHDYTKPLDVHWLCTPCHALRHGPARLVSSGVSVPAELWERTTEAATMLKVSRAEVIRRALALYFAAAEGVSASELVRRGAERELERTEKRRTRTDPRSTRN